jgi:hypothetical protein
LMRLRAAAKKKKHWEKNEIDDHRDK